jgi:hypothetical protein
MAEREQYFNGIEFLPIGSPKRSFELAVNMGRIPGFSTVDKYGENPNIIASGSGDIWETGGSYIYDADGTDPIKYISSDNVLDTGQTIKLTGLDVNGAEVAQTAITDGQNNVILTTPLWRLYRMENESNVGDDINGTLYGHIDAAPTAGVPLTVNVRATIDNGNNQTLMALYTVPKGKVGFLYLGEIGCGLSGAGSTTSEFATLAYQSRRFGKLFKIKKRIKCSVNGNSNYQNKRSFPDIIPALTDITLRAEFVSDVMSVWGAFDILLVDEKNFPDSYLTAIGQPGF